MPEVIQGQDPEENGKLVKNVVPDEPENERPLDLDDWERYLNPKLMIGRPYLCITEQLPSPEVRSPLSLPPNQESAKMPNQQKMVNLPRISTR
ncbi:hypothetical protein POTOM_034731 [Populus tomentosa]|uniref:Uncharacterized protein n=1 Tax=Populus tomentosa TaxID=118781 RepID=A0A8X7Z322_POPTO|nr:hypothetical protein POTOM_034731 [Populus tomentosa]